MRKLFASFLSLSLVLISCTSPTPIATPTLTATTIPSPTPTVTPIPSPTSTATPIPTENSDLLKTPWEDRAIFQSGLVESEQHVLNELMGASVYHLEFNIADDIYHVTGMEEVQYTNTESVALSEVEFRLFPNILGGEIQVTNVQVDGQPIIPQYEFANSLMIVPLPKTLEPQQSIVLKMDFAVTVPQTVDLNYGVLAYFENVLAFAHAYPMICVYDDEGWNAEIPSQDGDVTYTDASFYIVRINAPKELTLVTSGRQVNHIEAGQVQTLTVASGPARDFYLAASLDYVETSQTFGNVTIRSYSPANMQEGSDAVIDTASKAIKVYSERYAPYPYTELDFVSTPTLALGIEYPGMIALTSWLYDLNGGNEKVDIYLESTVAHEVGHQWFYNLVGDDQLDDPWLDESLTQFATLQYFTDTYGPQGSDGFRASLESRWAGVDKTNIPIGLPVADYKPGEYGAIVYGRGPLFFVALRDEITAPVFDSFIKDYSETLSWGIATPGFMQSLAEQYCACHLDTIFNEWVYP